MRVFSLLGLVTTIALGSLVAGCGTSEVPTASESPAGDGGAADITLVSFANEACPIMEGEPTPELTREWDGKTIGFCCDGCPEKWDALSEEEKAEKLAEASVAKGGHDHGDHDHGDHDHGDHDHGDHDHGDSAEAASETE